MTAFDLAVVIAVWLILSVLGVLAMVAWCVRARAAARRQPPLVPAVVYPCGCLTIGGVLVVSCDTAAEPPVEQWAAEMDDL